MNIPLLDVSFVLESLFNKVSVLRPIALLKKTPVQVLSCKFWEMFKSTYFIEHL